MCLIAFSWRSHPQYLLVLAANRDEFHARETAGAEFWSDVPDVLAGRDLEAGGTWLGITRTGRFAVLSNYRDGEARRGRCSRGKLVSRFLSGCAPPSLYTRTAYGEGSAYGGFNLLVGEIGGDLYYVSNYGDLKYPVTPGVHGVSNGLLDDPWPKVRRLCRALEVVPGRRADAESVLFEALADRAPAPDAALPDTGIGLERERLLSPPFIAGRDYGTRASTVILVGHDGAVSFTERRFGPDGAFEGNTRQEFTLASKTTKES